MELKPNTPGYYLYGILFERFSYLDLTPLTTCAGIGDAIAKATKKPLAGTMAGALCGMIGVEAFKKEFNK